MGGSVQQAYICHAAHAIYKLHSYAKNLGVQVLMNKLTLIAALFLVGCPSLSVERNQLLETEPVIQMLPQTNTVLVKKNQEILDTKVWVKRDRIKDSMGPNEEGEYLYYYEYDLYSFSSEKYFVEARSYVVPNEEASFTGLEINGVRRFLQAEDFQLPFMRVVIGYLKSEGKTSLKWLDTGNTKNGYSNVP